jgi:hypothetical protein
MENNLDAYRQKIAERGLTVLGFDGYTLNLAYDVTEDRAAAGPVSGDEINRFAVNALNDLPGDGDPFRGIRRVSTNFGLDL